LQLHLTIVANRQVSTALKRQGGKKKTDVRKVWSRTDFGFWICDFRFKSFSLLLIENLKSKIENQSDSRLFTGVCLFILCYRHLGKFRKFNLTVKLACVKWQDFSADYNP